MAEPSLPPRSTLMPTPLPVPTSGRPPRLSVIPFESLGGNRISASPEQGAETTGSPGLSVVSETTLSPHAQPMRSPSTSSPQSAAGAEPANTIIDAAANAASASRNVTKSRTDGENLIPGYSNVRSCGCRQQLETASRKPQPTGQYG